MTTNAIDRGKRQVVEVPVTCRLDTKEEVSMCKADCVLQRIGQDYFRGNSIKY